PPEACRLQCAPAGSLGASAARAMHCEGPCSTFYSSSRPSPSSQPAGRTCASASGSAVRREPRIRHRSSCRGAARRLSHLCAAGAGAVPAMTAVGWAQISIYFLLVLALTKPLGAYMFRIFAGNRQPLPALLGRLERFLYRLFGGAPAPEPTPTLN